MAQPESSSTHRFSLKAFLGRYKLELLLGLIFFLLGIVMQIMGGIRGQSGVVLAGVLCAVGALPFLGFVVLRYSRQPRTIEVAPEALQWTDHKGPHSQSWDRVVEVFRQEYIFNGDRYSYLSAQFGDGSRMTCDHSMTGYDELAEAVQRYSTPPVLAVKQKEFQGGRATFGAITLQSDGIDVRRGFAWGGGGLTWSPGFFPWEGLKHEVINGRLVLTHGKKQSIVPLKNIPNYVSLLILLHEKSPPAPAAVS